MRTAGIGRAAWPMGLMCCLVWLAVLPREAKAACGSVTCFIVIGSQQQIPQKGLLTTNLFYTWTPMSRQGGTSGVIPAIDQGNRRLILDHHQELRTITQTATLDFNYGVTEQFGLEVTIPFLSRVHHHIDGLGETNGGAGNNVDFGDNGLGDIRLTAKYNLLPTLRSMLVAGFGIFNIVSTITHEKARDIAITDNPLIGVMHTNDRAGICHQLANDDRMTWVRPEKTTEDKKP